MAAKHILQVVKIKAGHVGPIMYIHLQHTFNKSDNFNYLKINVINIFPPLRCLIAHVVIANT